MADADLVGRIEALEERLAQAHLTDLDRQSLPTRVHTRRAAGKH